MEAALAWCLREAVTNVVRHSGAKTCRISLTRHGGTLTLTVRDDGRGIPPRECTVGVARATPTAHPSRGEGAGTGLHGMTERLIAVGGSLELRPDAGPGLCLVATVPGASTSPSASSSHDRVTVTE
jgi:two-component system sensor histidine kinase DesK